MKSKMIYYCFIFIAIGTICCVSCTSKRVDILSTIPDGFKPMYMYGNIKEVVVTSEYMSDTIKLDKDGRILQKGHRHYSYNEDGTLNEQNTGQVKEEYVYDDNLLVATKLGSLNVLNKYFYNEQNKLISKKQYCRDELNNEWQYEYNEDGNLSCERKLSYAIANYMYHHYGSKTKPHQSHTMYYYDDKGNITKEEWYNSSELGHSTNFKYDKKGNVVKEENLDYDEMEKEIITYTYKYDRKGNWIEQVATCDGETKITKRKISYY